MLNMATASILLRGSFDNANTHDNSGSEVSALPASDDVHEPGVAGWDTEAVEDEVADAGDH